MRLIWAAVPLVTSATDDSSRNDSTRAGAGRTPAVEVDTARS